MFNISSSRCIITCFILLTALTGCGRKGALEAPPNDATPRIAQKPNTFFNPASKKEKLPVDPTLNQPMNPQLVAGGQLVITTNKTPGATSTGTNTSAGIAPVGGGRKAKRILPPQKDFILDPLL